MKKILVIVIVLIAALIASIGFTAYQATQNSTQSSQQVTKLEMATRLTQAQVQINTQLQTLSSDVATASAKLSTTGLSSSQASEILSELAQSSPYVIDVSTLDLHGTFITVQPANYSNIEGSTTDCSYDTFTSSKDPVQTVMSGPFPLAEGVYGSVIMAPIFSSDGTLIGSVSLAFDQSALIGAISTEACEGTPYVIWGADTEGTMIYEVNPSEVGTNLFTDATISTWTSLQTFAHQMVNQTAGYGTYEYFNYDNTDRTVTKQAYWATIGIYDAEWRLIITNVMP